MPSRSLPQTLIAPILAVCIALGLFTTAGAQTAEPAAPAESAAPAAPLPEINTVVATVNGTKITLGEIIALRQMLPEQYQSLPDEVLFNGLVDEMVGIVLLDQAAAKSGMTEPASLKYRFANQRREAMANAYLRGELDKRLTDEAVAARYAADYTDKPAVEEVRAAHILVPEQEKADDLKAQLDGGADFAALAAEHGTDGTSTRGGDLGWFDHSMMVPQFADAAFAMQPGEISAPVESPFGWHLIKLDERRTRAVPSLAEVRDTLIDEMSREMVTTLKDGLLADAEVVTPDPALTPGAIRQDALLD